MITLRKFQAVGQVKYINIYIFMYIIYSITVLVIYKN